MGEPSLPLSSHRQKSLAQTLRWQTEVLPTLIAPYMKYLRESGNLSQDVSLQQPACVCQGLRERTLDIVKLTMNICECRSAPVQLIECGLFGSAPKELTLAVDVRVLDFVTRLFLRISPNHTGLSNTIEDFLKCQGYQMKGKV
ncbi:hypothetical protein F5880DRAFT_1493836 [Lentinula raphanica]|nr:hypothetical protein F5880DRAFT_1493836 [Lentinula raphanica]